MLQVLHDKGGVCSVRLIWLTNVPEEQREAKALEVMVDVATAFCNNTVTVDDLYKRRDELLKAAGLVLADSAANVAAKPTLKKPAAAGDKPAAKKQKTANQESEAAASSTAASSAATNAATGPGTEAMDKDADAPPKKAKGKKDKHKSKIDAKVAAAEKAAPVANPAGKTKKRLVSTTASEPATNEAAGPGTEATDKDAEAPPKKAKSSKGPQEKIAVKVAAAGKAKPEAVVKVAAAENAAPKKVVPPLKSALKTSRSPSKKTVKFSGIDGQEDCQVRGLPSSRTATFEDESSDDMAPPPVSMFSV